MFLAPCWVVALIGIAAAAPSALSETEPQFTGFITLIERGTRRVAVESHANKMVRRHVLTVTPQTVIVKREGDVEKTVNLDSLAVSNWVKVWFVGGEKGTYPLDVMARRIVIVDRL